MSALRGDGWWHGGTVPLEVRFVPVHLERGLEAQRAVLVEAQQLLELERELQTQAVRVAERAPERRVRHAQQTRDQEVVRDQQSLAALDVLRVVLEYCSIELSKL